MSPLVALLVLLVILFVLWIFCGGGEYEYIGLRPLDPRTRSNYLFGGFPEEPPSYPDEVCYPEEPSSRTSSTEVCYPEEPPSYPEIPPSYAEVPKVPETIDEPPRIPPTGRRPVRLVIEEEAPCIPELPINGGIDRTPRLPPSFGGTGQEIGGRKIRESKGQKKTCEALERIYSRPFERNLRPSFLRNPETGSNLEYDCYNAELRIAAEYNGPQHYQWPNFLGSRQTYEQFIAQVRRDQLKIELSDRNGIYLITVPYNVPHDKIEDYIRYYLPDEVRKRIQLGQVTL